MNSNPFLCDPSHEIRQIHVDDHDFLAIESLHALVLVGDHEIVFASQNIRFNTFLKQDFRLLRIA